MSRKDHHGRRGEGRSSRRYHDRVARRYDSIYDDSFWQFHDDLTWRTVKRHLPTDLFARCADFGCGTGKWGLKLLKSGFAVTFVDNSGAMVDQVRHKLDEMGSRGQRGQAVIGDIVDLSGLESGQFSLILAMGDPLSICSDAARAVAEMYRLLAAGGVVIATGDNLYSALPHYVERGDLDALRRFVRTQKTRWLTSEAEEQFELTTFTPTQFRRLFRKAGFSVLDLAGKTLLPLRRNRDLLAEPGAAKELARLEARLARDPLAIAAAPHLQIVARKEKAS